MSRICVPLFRCLLLALAVMPVLANAQAPVSRWTGTGRWTSTAHWSHGLPTVFTEATVGGESAVTVPDGDFTVARLNVGTEPGDHARVSLDGGHLLVRQDSLIVGEYTGGSAEFTLNSGLLESVMDVFVGGATGSSKRMNHSVLRVRGGTLIGLSLTVGEGLGSQSTLSVEGSQAAAIRALEFVALQAEADPSGRPGEATLSYTVDEHGVTPISLSSRFSGLRIEHDATSHCRLRVSLSAVPPRDDITLVASRVATRGTFSDLPEGAEIAADYAGRTYRWTLTYKGGSSGHDVVLRNQSVYAADALVSHTLPVRPLPEPSWYGHPIYPLTVSTGVSAFPGAEGYGAYTPGGRGGRTLYVENLNDSGAGSLRAALESSGPRIVSFRVSGTISLQSAIVIGSPYLTFDASSAPAPGITLRRHGLEVHTHDVIFRQFRIRIGDEDVRREDESVRYGSGDGEYALYFTEGAANAIADHLSLSWSTNKILSTTKFADRITVQWCILSEALNLDQHGFASLVGGNRVSWHHNLFAHNLGRNPRFQGAVDADFRNNVIYDWGETAGYGEFDRLNYVGNYLKPGTSTAQKPQLFLNGIESVAPASLFFTGNVLEGNTRATEDNWHATGFYFTRETIAAPEPFPAPAISSTSAATAYREVLAGAGAVSPQRDSTDARIVNEVRTGTGHIIQSPDEVGGREE
ncbi:pectate lyase family protein [Granulicella mallensis]|uniref:Pectate lyase n=1 Tax=Granulicella mallensis (strain ATCC BAA-1857 / DSM 23137 / MP5ACTX8) TaxID=682795 RepID=G8NT68_GRAMM|nr:hypothetical protein [Granulicella mallensis]AEU37498.1 hypothetical protein AciX8_3197 [Granulicella mallensis MP5ACTX8]